MTAKKLKPSHATNPIDTWSPTAWFNFVECPSHPAYDKSHKRKLKRQDDSPALVHGRAVHEEYQAIAEGTLAMARAKTSKDYLTKGSLSVELLRALQKNDSASFELEAAFTRAMKPTGWFDRDVWLRTKLDVAYKPDDDSLEIIDWKTGKPYAKDREQLDIYLWVATILAKVSSYTARLVYVKSNTEDKRTLTAARAKALGRVWSQRGAKLTNPKTKIIPTPSADACRFCPYSVLKGGPCEVAHGVRSDARRAMHRWGSK